MINGKIYIVEDKGGGVKGNHIDVFYGTEEKANNEFGTQYHEVFIKTGGTEK